MASPKKIPTAIAKIGPDTSKGKRKFDTNEPQPALADVTPPAWLGDKALAVWNEYAPEAIRVGILTKLDVSSFGRYCVNMAEWLECHAAIQDPSRSPDAALREGWVKRRREADALLQRYEDSFGFNPSSRTKLSVTPQKPADPMDKFKAGPPTLKMAQ